MHTGTSPAEQRTEVDDVELGAVAQEQQHGVARPDAQSAQPAGEPCAIAVGTR